MPSSSAPIAELRANRRAWARGLTTRGPGLEGGRGWAGARAGAGGGGRGGRRARLPPGGGFWGGGGRGAGQGPAGVARQGPRRDAAQGALAGVPALPLDLPFAGPAAGPHPGQLPADPCGPHHGQQPGALPGLVLGQPAPEVPRPPDVVPGVLVGPVEMQQVDGARRPALAGHGVTPAARATAVAMAREFAAPMTGSRYRFSPSATATSRTAISDVDAAAPASAHAR